jgi:uncharacterized protein GlcG (DUF336 family)
MSIQTYTIELRVDTSDEGHEALRQVLKQTARDFLATATIVTQGANPQVCARADDAFYNSEEIEVLDTHA